MSTVWMAGQGDVQSPGRFAPDLVLFFSFYVLLVLMLGLWSRTLARQNTSRRFGRKVRRFNQVMLGARVLVPVWFAIGVWGLGWSSIVMLLGPVVYRSVIGMTLGTLPAVLAWMGLWWSQYPAERALREQNLLVDLDNDLPLYQPPTFRSYFWSNFRLQVLFTLLPVALIVLLHDAFLSLGLWLKGLSLATEQPPQVLELTSFLLAASLVFLFAPVLLRRVLSTRPMPNSPLRQRLEELCVRAGVRYRQILVWNTNNHVGNAAVMGIVPQLRYVLLSDVLLERMSDQEIEAVFAHELGHVVHRHMTWYAIFLVVMTLLTTAAMATLPAHLNLLASNSAQAIGTALATAGAFVLFGALSRRCERQADVFAARMMEMLQAETPLASEGLFVPRQLVTVGAGAVAPQRMARETHVGRHGAWLFASALRRVASINNIPVTPPTQPRPGVWNRVAHWADGLLEMAGNWLHGSIASRMQYLQDLSADPRLTNHFDRTMFWLYCGILFALFMSVLFFSVTPGALLG